MEYWNIFPTSAKPISGFTISCFLFLFWVPTAMAIYQILLAISMGLYILQMNLVQYLQLIDAVKSTKLPDL